MTICFSLKGRKGEGCVEGKAACEMFLHPLLSWANLCADPILLPSSPGLSPARGRLGRGEREENFLFASQSPPGEPHGGVFIEQPLTSKDRGTSESSSYLLLGLTPPPCLSPSCLSSWSLHTAVLSGLAPSRSP